MLFQQFGTVFHLHVGLFGVRSASSMRVWMAASFCCCMTSCVTSRGDDQVFRALPRQQRGHVRLVPVVFGAASDSGLARGQCRVKGAKIRAEDLRDFQTANRNLTLDLSLVLHSRSRLVLNTTEFEPSSSTTPSGMPSRMRSFCNRRASRSASVRCSGKT
jgi:hypothetical protein